MFMDAEWWEDETYFHKLRIWNFEFNMPKQTSWWNIIDYVPSFYECLHYTIIAKYQIFVLDNIQVDIVSGIKQTISNPIEAWVFSSGTVSSMLGT